MTSAAAFLPSVAIDEPPTIGPLRLLPYHRGKVPGALPHATQAAVRAAPPQLLFSAEERAEVARRCHPHGLQLKFLVGLLL